MLVLDKWWAYGWSEAAASDELGNYFYLGSGAYVRIYSIAENPDVPRLLLDYNVGGFVNRILVKGNYAYVVTTAGENLQSDASLLILDITNRGSPALVTRYEGVKEIAEIAIEGNYLYLGRFHLGLTILDVTDKTSPRIVSTYKSGFDRVERLVVRNGLVYAIDSAEGNVNIYDATNPISPTKVGGITGLYSGFDIAIDGNYLFLTIYYTNYALTAPWLKGLGLVIYDITNPVSPVLFQTVPGYSPGNFYGWTKLKIVGSKVFVAATSNGVGVIDLSGMTATTPPAIIAKYALKRYAREVVVAKNRFYVLHGYGFVVWDMATGAYTEYREYARVFTVASTGNQYVFGLGDEWFWVFDVTADPFVPIYKQTIGGRIREKPSIWTKAGKTYLSSGTGWGGFLIFDVTNPTAPYKIYENATMNLMDVHYDGVNDVLWVAALLSHGYQGVDQYIRSFDVSDLNNIKLIEDYWVGRSVYNITGEYNVKYVRSYKGHIYMTPSVTNTKSLFIYKIGADKKLTFVKRADLASGSILILEFEGDYGYFGTDTGFYVLDMKIPDNPVVIARIPTITYATSILPMGNAVYVTSSIGFTKVNVANRAAPAIEETVMLYGIKPSSVTKSNDKLVLAAGEVGVLTAKTGPLPGTKWKCSGPPDYACTESVLGEYNSLEECRAACQSPPPLPKYSCSGAPNYQCVQNPNGQFNSIAECQAACAAPARYRCSGYPDYQCIQDPTGNFGSLAECQVACSAPARYRCSGYPDYQCIQDPTGNFGSLAECQAVCKLTAPPPSINVVGVVVTLAGLGAIVYSLKRVASSRP